MQKNILGIGGLLLLAFVLLSSSMYSVAETDQVVVLRLGRESRVINAPVDSKTGKPITPSPGLHFKLPIFEEIVRFDKRVLELDVPEQEVLATDKQRMVVDAFGRFRIVDPLQTYRSVRTENGARDQLASILASRLRDALGQETFAGMLSPERTQLMGRIRDSVNQEAKKYGTQIVDVRIKRADVPLGDPLEAVLLRMQTERQQEARGIRAKGEQEAQEIRAKADVTAAQIYADSFGRDAQFYDFYRSLQAYQRTLRKEDTTVVLSPDNAFMAPFRDGR